MITACSDCSGTRAVPGLFGDYVACPSCVIDAGETFVVFENVPEDDPQS